MNIEDLKANGGIVESQLTQRTAYWNGSEITFYVRKLSFGDVDRIYNGENLDASQAAEMISKAVRLGDNGDEALTYEQAYSLDPNLATVFAEHVMEVNGVGEDAGDEGIHRDAVDLAPLGEEPVQRLRDAEIDAVTLDPLQLVPPDIALTHEYS